MYLVGWKSLWPMAYSTGKDHAVCILRPKLFAISHTRYALFLRTRDKRRFTNDERRGWPARTGRARDLGSALISESSARGAVSALRGVTYDGRTEGHNRMRRKGHRSRVAHSTRGTRDDRGKTRNPLADISIHTPQVLAGWHRVVLPVDAGGRRSRTPDNLLVP